MVKCLSVSKIEHNYNTNTIAIIRRSYCSKLFLTCSIP
ncbi:unnamed protein product [Schistosoma curassoni]|uniref:Kinesin motor domain-containing protein n=1 Tax=Schistosoma curassoni TaxID=6186 RepID=A0A183JUB3_9TREM|nr:unnamed protein product [Schistosoma curassoni]